MRASVLSWPMASGLPLFVCAATIVQPLAALAAGDAPASVSFVDRDALGAGFTSGSGNPLRAPATPASRSTRKVRTAKTHSATPRRQAKKVRTPRSPTKKSSPLPTARDPNGLQLRPYSEPTGIFSGDSPNQQSRPKQYPPQQKHENSQQVRRNAVHHSSIRYRPRQRTDA